MNEAEVNFTLSFLLRETVVRFSRLIHCRETVLIFDSLRDFFL